MYRMCNVCMRVYVRVTCVCVCMCVCAYTWMYIQMNVYMRVCASMSMKINEQSTKVCENRWNTMTRHWMSMYMNMYIYTPIYICMFVCICMYVWTSNGNQGRQGIRMQIRANPWNITDHRWNSMSNPWTSMENLWTPMERHLKPCVYVYMCTYIHEYTCVCACECVYACMKKQRNSMDVDETQMTIAEPSLNAEEHQWTINGRRWTHMNVDETTLKTDVMSWNQTQLNINWTVL